MKTERIQWQAQASEQRTNLTRQKRGRLYSVLFAVHFIVLATIACITTTTRTCVDADTMVGQSVATIKCSSGGVNMTVPSFVLYLAEDCNVPWTCATTGMGYWDYAVNTNATCTAAVNRWDYQPDCSAIITFGAGVATLGPCTSQTPTGEMDCPATEISDPDCLAANSKTHNYCMLADNINWPPTFLW
jgi:hypothetical protein